LSELSGVAGILLRKKKGNVQSACIEEIILPTLDWRLEREQERGEYRGIAEL
jgi:hypothetical protein